jgi:hypothetical protein
MKDIEKKQQVKESAEAILSGKLGWTAFTTWAKDHFSCSHYKANQLWNLSWKLIQEDAKNKISYSAQAAFIELEDVKQWALNENDRRAYLDALKYQGKINKLEDPDTQININADKIKLSWGSKDE